MPLTVKIAWRNVFRHRSKSLVIGIILFAGAFLLTMGNSVISGMESGLDRNIVEGFTGDVILVSDKQEDDNVLLGVSGQSIEKIPRFDTLRLRLESAGLFQALLPVGKDFALVINERGGSPGYASILGVDFRRWLAMFPGSLEFVKGDRPDSSGLVLPIGGMGQLYSSMGVAYWPKGVPLDTSLLNVDAKSAHPGLEVQNEIVFMGFSESNTSSDIRLPVEALARFRALNSIWGGFVFMDIDAYRRCMGLFTAGRESVPVDLRDQALLRQAGEDLDAMFGDTSFLAAAAAPSVRPVLAVAAAAPVPAEDQEAGIHNLVLGRFLPGADRQEAIDSLQRFLTANSIPLRPLTWQKATGSVGSMTVFFKVGLNVFVAFIFLIAAIIIVNTLTMTAMERAPEIAMMRAVGAQKSLISGILFNEASLLSIVFGGLGLLVGLAAAYFIREMGLRTDNDLLQLLYGGDTFQPVLGMGGIAATAIQLVLVSGLASLYPMRVAQSIQPLDAVARD